MYLTVSNGRQDPTGPVVWVHTGAVEPTPEEVRAQLERLLASETLATAARLRRFLRFIVERTLDGKGEQLKEYAVGIEVFERDERYDPRIDSIVRVEAGRLRARLQEYYTQAGCDDTVIVRIPRGGYVPRFRAPARTTDSESAFTWVGCPTARTWISSSMVVDGGKCPRHIDCVARCRDVVATHWICGRKQGSQDAGCGVAICLLLD